MKKYIIALLASIFVFTVFLTGCAKEEPAAPAPATNTQESSSNGGTGLQKFVPPVSFKATAIDGTEITSDILADSKLTMINVWATYCNPCLKEMPDLGEIAASYDPSEFQILGIISDATITSDQETLDYAQSLIDETNANYTHLLLNEDLYYGMLLEVSAVPTTVFIDSKGKIVSTIVGSMEKADWEAVIEDLLNSL